MQQTHTVFDTPVVKTVLHGIATLFLRLIGWRTEGEVPDIPRYVIVAAPHTTNWDLPITLAMAFKFGVKPYWMGKDSLFRGPFGPFFRWLGGVAIDRSKSTNVVGQWVNLFRENDQLILVVAPEGTRSKVSQWKTGFYHIAAGAGVPVVLGFLDYRRKVGGIGPIVIPTGEVEADMRRIRKFYRDIEGKHTSGWDAGPSDEGA